MKIKGKRAYYVYYFFLCLFIALALRIFYLQIFQKDFLQNLANKQHYRIIPIEGSRGKIFDRQGRIFVTDIKCYSVFADPQLASDPAKSAKVLAPLLGVSKEELIQTLNKKNRRFEWLKRKVSWEEKEKIKTLGLREVGMLREEKRFYPQETLASCVLGTVDIDNKGLEGLELSYDSYLRGKQGWVRILQDSASRQLILSPQAVAPQPGTDIVLAIDMQIQYWAQKHLEETVREFRAKGGAAIVMDAQSGQILAMANYPNFDPNNITKKSLKFIKNRAVCDMFEPGSVFKIVTLIAAIDSGAFQPQRRIFCENGEWKIPGTVLNDWKPFGELSYMEAFKNSSNIGVAKIAISLEKDMFYLYIKKLGFGELSGVDFPGEIPGMLRHYTKWSRTSSYIVPIGQEVGVTLLQLVRAYAAVANGGFLVTPSIVKSVRVHGFDKEVPLERYRVISEEAASLTAQVLIKVVEDGTGTLAQIKGMTVGGKTGTAQKYDPQVGSYSLTKYRASFVGFVSNFEPALVIGVTIDEPQKAHLGGTVAAPLFQRIAQKAIAYMKGEVKTSKQ